MGLLADAKDVDDQDWEPFSQYGGLWDYINWTLPVKPLDAAQQRQMRLDDEARHAARTGNWQQLIQATSLGANVTAQDPIDGHHTAMHLAAAGGHVGVIEVSKFIHNKRAFHNLLHIYAPQ